MFGRPKLKLDDSHTCEDLLASRNVRDTEHHKRGQCHTVVLLAVSFGYKLKLMPGLSPYFFSVWITLKA